VRAVVFLPFVTLACFARAAEPYRRQVSRQFDGDILGLRATGVGTSRGSRACPEGVWRTRTRQVNWKWGGREPS